MDYRLFDTLLDGVVVVDEMLNIEQFAESLEPRDGALQPLAPEEALSLDHFHSMNPH